MAVSVRAESAFGPGPRKRGGRAGSSENARLGGRWVGSYRAHLARAAVEGHEAVLEVLDAQEGVPVHCRQAAPQNDLE